MDATTHAAHAHEVHEAHHEEMGFWRKYIFSTDHKIIGIQYGFTALCFLMFGFCLMALMRWSMAYPDRPIPLVGPLLERMFGADVAPNGAMTADLYNAFGAMHGTIMVFLAIVPLAFAAFGNFVVPLQIGAPDMAFPRVNMVSYQAYFLGGVIMFASFFIPGGAAKSGWTSYSPIATLADLAHPWNGQTFWILGMVCLINSSLLGAINFIATIIQLRAPGVTWMRLPFFVWAQFVTAFLLLLAFPPLEAAAVMQLMDNQAGTSFFLPSCLVVAGQVAGVSGGRTGLPLGFNFRDLHLHDTYYVIAHCPYVVAPGTIFGLFAGIYFWYPKITGRMMNEFWGKVHFLLSLIFMNLVFQPMFAQGFAGLNRRMYDGGATYALAQNAGVAGAFPAGVMEANKFISHAVWFLGLAQLPFIINFFYSMFKGRKVTSDNPWGSTIIEWQTPTPPPHGNFARPVAAHRGPYEYSVPGAATDFTPQTQP